VPAAVANPNGPTEDRSRSETFVSIPMNVLQNSGVDEVAESWRRCIAEHHVNPKSVSLPNIVTQGELRVSKESVAEIISQAREEIDRLYAIVRQQEYVVLLCNDSGVAIHHRGDESRAEDFKGWGIWLGGVWSEQVEGTNGIGTCIAEQRPVLVHCGQHFRSRHRKLTCAGAPIFDAQNELVGVLDVSAVANEGPDHPQQLALAATIASARAIEERLFRGFFRHAWIVAALPSGETLPALLLAVDDEQRVIGADRVARMVFGLESTHLSAGVPFSTLFDFRFSLFRRRGGQDIPAWLTRAGGNDAWRALISQPLAKSGVSRLWPEALIHSQPRLSMLSSMVMPNEPDVNRGGLSPVLKDRICDFIESHISEKVSLDALSSMAGLSPHHFARAFQQSVGMPPHRYLLRRRLEHVEKMLRDTQLPLAEIAQAVGFVDQSHLARHFRRIAGVPPSVARGTLR
jgi:AraC-like DNA-binding protein